MTTNVEVHNVHYQDDPRTPFYWGMIAEWCFREYGLGGVVFREGKREDFDEQAFTEMVRELAEGYVSKYIKAPEESIFARICPDHEGRIDTLGEMQTYTYKSIKGIRVFVGKEDYNVYFWPGSV